MIEVRPFKTLGHANHGWLETHHHFSFAHYINPNRMKWGHLRVWNDDTIAPGTGFDAHPHRDMEIITYVLSGAITHKDSLGNIGRTEAGNVQVMSAGTGIFHSEYNLESTPTQIFQIWLIPTKKGHKPSWRTRHFPKSEGRGQIDILASGYAEDEDALPIHTKARIIGITLQKGQKTRYPLGKERLGYLVPAMGNLLLNGQIVTSRAGAAISQQDLITVEALEKANVILVDSAA